MIRIPFKHHLHLFVAVTIVAALIGLPLAVTADTTVRTLYFTPSGGSYTVGNSFKVQLRENSGSVDVDHADVQITYPDNLIGFNESSLTGSAFPTNVKRGGANGNVTIDVTTSSKTVNEDQLIATLTFTAKAAGSAVIGLANSSAIDETATGKNEVPNRTNASFTIDAKPAPAPAPAPTPTPTPKPSPAPAPAPAPAPVVTSGDSGGTSGNGAADQDPYGSDSGSFTGSDTGSAAGSATGSSSGSVSGSDASATSSGTGSSTGSDSGSSTNKAHTSKNNGSGSNTSLTTLKAHKTAAHSSIGAFIAILFFLILGVLAFLFIRKRRRSTPNIYPSTTSTAHDMPLPVAPPMLPGQSTVHQPSAVLASLPPVPNAGQAGYPGRVAVSGAVPPPTDDPLLMKINESFYPSQKHAPSQTNKKDEPLDMFELAKAHPESYGSDVAPHIEPPKKS